MIDRSNYEIWIIDWLDGNLTDIQVDGLFSFLDRNPDLKEEMKELSGQRLEKKKMKFRGKSSLRRSVSDITDRQFEYLCVGHFENDLSPEQEKELEQIAEVVPGKKETLHTYMRTKLVPPDYMYPGKKSLKKKTAFQRSMKQIMNAAASVGLIIFIYTLSTWKLADQKIAELADPALKGRVNESIKRDSVFNKDTFFSALQDGGNGGANENIIKDSAFIINIPVPIPSSIYPAFQSGIISGIPDYDNEELIVYRAGVILPDLYDDRGRVERFLTRAYRNVLLNEKENSLPLNRYELAKGGVSGLNRLLGWNMNLQATNDENGNIESFYFSSKILKFSVPVKKSDNGR